MGIQKLKAAAKENIGSGKRATTKTSKAAETLLEVEASQTRKFQGAGLKSGTRKSKSRAVETDGTLLKKELEKAGTIGNPTEPLNPKESNDEVEEKTPVEKSGTLNSHSCNWT